MRLRFTPNLSFQYDSSFDYAEHIASLLDGPARPRPDVDEGTDGG